MPTLVRVTDPQTWILTVDDDVRHLPAAIERLEDAALADPDSAHGYSDYTLWRKWQPGKPVDFLAGFGGCLFKRSFFGRVIGLGPSAMSFHDFNLFWGNLTKFKSTLDRSSLSLIHI